ncbi:MAG: ABC transporter ATP-binding protein [Treponema sp.]
MSKKIIKSQEKKDKISIGRIISNVFYILKDAMKYDKFFVVSIITIFIIMNSAYAFLDTYLFKVIIDMIMSKSSKFSTIILAIVGIAVVSIIANGLDVTIDYYSQARFVKLGGKVRQDLIKKASEIDLICYDNKEYFDDFVIAASQSDQMMSLGIMSVARILSNIAAILTAGGFIMTINPLISIVPIVGFIVNMLTRFAITKLEYDFEIDQGKLMRKADYSRRVFYQPEYAKEIKLSSIDVPLRKQFNKALDEIKIRANKAGKKIAVLSLINWIVVFTLLSNLVVPLYLAYLVLVKVSMNFAEMTAVNNAQGDVRDRLDWMNYAIVDFQKVGLFVEKYRRFLDYKIEIENSKGTVGVPEEFERRRDVLDIDHISFRYKGADKDTLTDITMKIHPGEHIAIVGENGAGKSTFIKLLMRLYDVTGGSIKYGEHNIKEFSTKDYRQLFGAVFQDFQLYGASLAENVLMDERAEDTIVSTINVPHETYDEQNDRITKALELADFSEKFKKLKNGLNTEMTREFYDEGTMLSGGESQKVAISRMFAKHLVSNENMAVAILDEPSSALDPQAEYILNNNMLEAAGDAAVIFISHRLSTTREADKIYLFANGSIAEQGTHEELMALNGEYAAMFEKQAHYYQEE